MLETAFLYRNTAIPSYYIDASFFCVFAVYWKQMMLILYAIWNYVGLGFDLRFAHHYRSTLDGRDELVLIAATKWTLYDAPS